jgi:prepilin-type N-terminal cleavage/methylation domain-containing protein
LLILNMATEGTAMDRRSLKRGIVAGPGITRPERPLTPGFTLIELLVVIAVIAVLVAILVPCLARAREAGRRAACMGHMHQIQTAWYLYAVDHGDYIVNGQPSFWVSPSGTEVWTGGSERKNDGRPWLIQHGSSYSTARAAEAAMRTGALSPYVGDVRAYLCPNRYRHGLKAGGVVDDWQWLSSYTIHSSMNTHSPLDWGQWDRDLRARYSVGRTVLYVRKTSELVDPGPAVRAVFIDQPSDGQGWIGPGIHFWRPGQPGNFLSVAPIHHSDGTCLSFADGHVEYWKWLEPETVAWGHWNYDASGPAVEQMPRPPIPKADGPDYVRLFRAIWGKWPASRQGR